ncbi:hypothetical protein LINGRAHAP2_LOCUS10469 [Linum grandiflorum]
MMERQLLLKLNLWMRIIMEKQLLSLQMPLLSLMRR